MNNQQLFQLIVFALIAGSSGLGWVLRKLREHAEKRALEEKRARAQLESLRTGREVHEKVPAPVNVSAEANELAERRKRQLDELRRRQARAEGDLPRPVPTAGQPGRQTPPPIPAQRQQQQPRPQNRDQRARERGGQRKDRNTAAERQPARQEMPASTASQPPSPRRIAEEQARTGMAEAAASVLRTQSAPAESVGRSPRAAQVRGTPITPQDWRRAVIMNEVLSPPVSLRD